jgi:hypothetical protein
VARISVFAVADPAGVAARQAPSAGSILVTGERPWMAAPASRAARASPRT